MSSEKQCISIVALSSRFPKQVYPSLVESVPKVLTKVKDRWRIILLQSKVTKYKDYFYLMVSIKVF